MDVLPGLRGMLNPHPVFVHFPIAFWLGALLFQILAVWKSNDQLHRTATWLLYLGTLGGLVAAGTGLYAEEAVPETGPAHHVMELHEKLMLISASLAVGLSMLAFFRRQSITAGMRKLLLVGLIVLAAVMAVGADRGAQLVYQYATSVHLPPPPK